LVLRKLAVRDRVGLRDIIGQGSLPILGLAAGEGLITAELLKYEPVGVSGLLNCSLSSEAVEADVKEGNCVASCESIVSRRGATSLFLPEQRQFHPTWSSRGCFGGVILRVEDMIHGLSGQAMKLVPHEHVMGSGIVGVGQQPRWKSRMEEQLPISQPHEIDSSCYRIAHSTSRLLASIQPHVIAFRASRPLPTSSLVAVNHSSLALLFDRPKGHGSSQELLR
ncbi:hypothetical protein KCU90_g85, partial [Aureobasidium melanogenum]